MKVMSMRGKVVDMNLLMAQNEDKLALGNAKMNARGDIVSSTGEIVSTSEQLIKQYNAANPRAVKQVSLKDLTDEVFATPAEAVAEIVAKNAKIENTEKPSDVAPSPQRKRKIEDRED